MNARILSTAVLLLFAIVRCSSTLSAADVPQSQDDRIVMELFAEHPQIVTPTGIAVDARGRVFVAESHTHFRPDDYDGPPADRILIFEDTDGDGRADRRAIFHEGFTHIMDLEMCRDGSLYVATRMNIHRLRDTTGDNRADEIIPIVKMETTGTYPHNGLSGLAFDFAGDLHFGLGENLGHNYTLVGSDGKKISGGGEGGSTYHCTADGKKLRRVSTGWWNPFGMCVDAYGRVFGTDNDPGASPPCRLIQVIEGADYGYEYRYGRTGLHPLITWTGDMPGTLPMIAGTGEAPCSILSYDSDALPDQYRGNLLVASWADHRIEYYPLREWRYSGLVRTKRHVLFEGGNEFRPVGLAMAPDGTIYVSDWVSSSYSLHKQGRIWRIRPKELRRRAVAASPQKALQSADREVRETAARKLAESEDGRTHLRRQLRLKRADDTRAAALQALLTTNDKETDYKAIANNESNVGLRALAVRQALTLGNDPLDWLESWTPHIVRAEVGLRLDVEQHQEELLAFLRSGDPLLFHAAVMALSRQATTKTGAVAAIAEKHPLGVLLAYKRNPQLRQSYAAKQLGKSLNADDEAVQLAAVKWIADDQLVEYREQLTALLDSDRLTFRLFLAVTAALDRLGNLKPADRPAPKVLLAKIADQRAPRAIRKLSLRLIDPTFEPLALAHFRPLLEDRDEQLRLEAVRTLAGHRDERRFEWLADVASDARQSETVRAAAVAGLAPAAEAHAELLVDLATGDSGPLRDEALRSLVGAKLAEPLKRQLVDLSEGDSHAAQAAKRVLGIELDTRLAKNLDFASFIMGPGDPQAGERIFFGTKVGTCSKCHEVRGRGSAVGPPLTHISRRIAAKGKDGRRWLLETIVDPSKEMAPQYTPWQIVTTDGKTLVGLPRRKGGSSEAYLGLDGKEFSVKKADIEMHREARKSVMPDDLLKSLTQQEISDLLAFLMQPE